jgi:Insertion element 4 transposase N-terminal
VIAETRSKEKRDRLLPARLVVYYVIALALFFGEAYEEVMRKMVGGLRFVSAWERPACCARNLPRWCGKKSGESCSPTTPSAPS